MNTKDLTTKKENINIKSINANFKFNVLLRDVEHFNKIILYLNEHVGRGVNNWTIGGRVLRILRRGVSVERTFYIFNQEVDESLAVFIKLL
jgi:hypothetical protein